MKYLRGFITDVLVGGVLVVLPIYLSVLLLLKGVQAITGLAHPVAVLLPAWIPARDLLAMLVLLIFCAAIGFAVRTRAGRFVRERVERFFFSKLPGYALFRGLTQRLAGKTGDDAWKPALVEIEEALVPAFVIEEAGPDRYTVFVPSAPTPLAGAVYVISRERVHPVDVPFTQAIRTISRWGAGSKELVAAMENDTHPRPDTGGASDTRPSPVRAG